MKNDLTCAVVRDLLPSYVEGLTSEETNQAVDAHLAQCPDCAAQKDAMAAPEAAEQVETAKEVDYLKAVKRRSRRRLVLAVVLAAALIAAGFSAKIFLIGTPIQSQTYALRAYADEENVLHLVIDCVSSAYAYKDWETEEQDGVVSVNGRMVTVSPLYKEGWGRLLIPLDGVEEVWLCEELIWQDGMVIGSWARECLEARTPYIGDAPAVSRLIETVHIPNLGRTYTLSLQTSAAPYGCTLAFEESMSGFQDHWMENYAWMLLALVDNLETVTWTYPDEETGVIQTRTVTLAESGAMLAEWTAAYNEENGTDWAALDSVKDYAASPADFQRLIDLLSMMLDARLGARANSTISLGTATIAN